MITILLLTSFSTYCYSQETPQEIAKKFFEVYSQGDTDKALDYIFSNNQWMKEASEQLDDVKRQVKKAVSQIGKYYGADLLATKSAGPNVMMLTYVVRHDRQPLLFSLMFYKPEKKWQMQNFKFGSAFDEELEEASKSYRLKDNYGN